MLGIIWVAAIFYLRREKPKDPKLWSWVYDISDELDHPPHPQTYKEST
jgi:hypothetical protein